MKEKFGESSNDSIRFIKLQSNGNDFVVIDATEQEIPLSKEFICKLSDRKRGVGFDQLLVLRAPEVLHADFDVSIFNQDGTETQQCVNGIRCLAHYVFQANKIIRDFVIFNLKTQLNRVYKEQEGLRTFLPSPIFEPDRIPLKYSGTGNIFNILEDRLQKKHKLSAVVSTDQIDFFTLSVGNPHIISLANEFNDEYFFHWGNYFQNCHFFPEKANFSMVKILDKSKFQIRTFERGVGETESCGSASVASFVALRELNLVNKSCHIINMKQEVLKANWDTQLSILGNSKIVFVGFINKNLEINSLLDLKTYSLNDFQDV